MLLLQISASQGPLECALAVAKALERLQHEAKKLDVHCEIVACTPESKQGTFRSVLLTLEGANAEQLAQQWQGSIQWICASPYRPHHKRKNWFIGIAVYDEPEAAHSSDIHFEACRASGPGGQHVNKTDSAIRATHLASGISVKVQSERSQHANKRLAVLLIEQKLAEAAEKNLNAQRAQRRMHHHAIERGHAARIFHGERFEPG